MGIRLKKNFNLPRKACITAFFLNYSLKGFNIRWQQLKKTRIFEHKPKGAQPRLTGGAIAPTNQQLERATALD